MVDKSPPARSRSLSDRGIGAIPWTAVLLTVAFALLVALLPDRSSGQSLGAIQNKMESTRSKLEHARGHEQVLTTDISALSGRIRSLEGQIATFQRRENRAQVVLDARRAELAKVQARYEQEHARYVLLRKKLARAQVILAQRLVEIYKSDPPDMVTVMLESDGFQDLLVRGDYLSRIGEQDSAIVARVKRLKRESARKRALLVELKGRAEAAVAVIEAKRQELAQARAGVQSRQGALASARNQKRGSLSNVRESRQHLEGDLAALEAASAQVTAQLQGSGPAPAGPIRQGSGGYIWPVNGPVVSPFGMRWGRLHAGIDIGAASGTAIRAAASGSVAMAGWMGGYGNYTCISHGGGIATCYAHQSSIGVSVGQSVKQGQVIGSVGCTGHCFGPHLHFEVRVNGTPVDPMGYL
jgi:murein DD-endopeptidase MepM/ murein hydrolase activator NlpD